MTDTEWMPIIDRDRCNGCGACISDCPTGALGWQDGKAALLYPALCIYRATCEEICPQGAITLPYLVCKAPMPPNPASSIDFPDRK